MDWNRKDRAPSYTIEKIKKILASLDLDVSLVKNTNIENQIFSCRLEFSQLPTIGSNGKGISSDYAQASAYAEIMERLQTGMLLDGYYFQKRSNQNDITPDINDIINIYRNYFSNFFEDKLYEKYLTWLIGRDASLRKMYPYFEANSGECVMLPDKFIYIMCGSNGVASGNSLAEACVQGICEVFERYVSKEIYKTKPPIFPVIDEKLYRDTNSYVFVNIIKSKGYEVIVKDCTMGGRFPVLGVILLSHNKTKYKVKLGSDINFDICLQRCFTEIMQGLDFISLKTNMNTFNAKHNNFWYLESDRSEFVRFYIDGTGRTPRSFFANNESIKPSLLFRPFVKKKIDNNEALIALCKILKENDKKLYLNDYSFLGFPTIRAYIPGMSEVMDSISIKAREIILDIHSAYANISNGNKEKYKQLYDSLMRLLDCQVINSESDIDNILGVLIREKAYKSLYHFTAELALFLGYSKDAFRLISTYYQKINNSFAARFAEIEKMIFGAISSNIKKSDLISLLNVITVGGENEKAISLAEYYYGIRIGDWSIEKCNQCEGCKRKEACCYPEWKKICDTLNDAKERMDCSSYSNRYYMQMVDYFK